MTAELVPLAKRFDRQVHIQLVQRSRLDMKMLMFEQLLSAKPAILYFIPILRFETHKAWTMSSIFLNTLFA